MTVEQLPALNASLNGLSTVLLLLGFYLIKQGKRQAHMKCMIAALCTSTVFLACYLYYHYHVGATRFTDPGWFKPFYLALLIPHVILAVVMLPFIFKALWHAYKGDFDRHKKTVKWAWPMWLFVSITGVLVYLILYQIFPQK